MKIALLFSLISLSAFAGTIKIRVCPFWTYRTDLGAWVCDATPKYVQVVTPLPAELAQDEERSIEADPDTKPEAKR